MSDIENPTPTNNQPAAHEEVHWMVRIRLAAPVRDAVRARAKAEMRSFGTMIGIILGESVTERSSA
jgi:hypothetical protein